MTDLALPRARTRTRRRKLPRPPKFTKWQKRVLAFESAMLALAVASTLADPSPAMIGAVAGWTAFATSTVQDALRPPRGGQQAGVIGCALALCSFVMWLA